VSAFLRKVFRHFDDLPPAVSEAIRHQDCNASQLRCVARKRVAPSKITSLGLEWLRE
jgi:hypothetical protein